MYSTRPLQRKLASLTLLVLAISMPGCAALVVGAAAGAAAGAGIVYVRGELRSNVNADPRHVVSAAEGALKQLDIAVISSEASGVDGRVRGRTADDSRVTIRVNSIGEDSSEIRIRVGVFGDEAKSRAILDRILERI